MNKCGLILTKVDNVFDSCVSPIPLGLVNYLSFASMIESASSVFEGTGVNVVTSCRFLGGVIGDHFSKVLFVNEKGIKTCLIHGNNYNKITKNLN